MEAANFDVMITADEDYKAYEEKADRRLALVVLGNGSWPVIQTYLPEIAAQVEVARTNSYAFVEMPMPPKRPFKRSAD